MKISEYIAALQTILAEHGDLPIAVRDKDDLWLPEQGPSVERVKPGDDAHLCGEAAPGDVVVVVG